MSLWNDTYTSDTIWGDRGEIDVISFIHDAEPTPKAQIKISARSAQFQGFASMEFSNPDEMRRVADAILRHADALEWMIAQGAESFRKAA